MSSKRRYRQRHKPYSRNRMSDPSMYTTNPRVFNNSAAMSTPKNKFITVTPEMREYAWSQRTDNIQKIPLNYTATQNGVDAINAPEGKAFDPVTFTVNVPNKQYIYFAGPSNDIVPLSNFVYVNAETVVPLSAGNSISVIQNSGSYYIIYFDYVSASSNYTVPAGCYYHVFNVSTTNYYCNFYDLDEIVIFIISDPNTTSASGNVVRLTKNFYSLPAFD